MIIHKLEMYNFRQYIDLQEVSFSTDPEKNVTVLIGVNTSGKTTIIRAFEWCLYGKNGFEDPVLINSEVRDNMNVGDTKTISLPGISGYSAPDKNYSYTIIGDTDGVKTLSITYNVSKTANLVNKDGEWYLMQDD